MSAEQPDRTTRRRKPVTGARETQGRIAVHQGLLVEDVTVEGDDLAVSVATHDGDHHRVTFHHAGGVGLDAHLVTLRRWMHHRTPVTYVIGGVDGALIDEDAWFAAAFGDDLLEGLS
jgi:hypothetical protein